MKNDEIQKQHKNANRNNKQHVPKWHGGTPLSSAAAANVWVG